MKILSCIKKKKKKKILKKKKKILKKSLDAFKKYDTECWSTRQRNVILTEIKPLNLQEINKERKKKGMDKAEKPTRIVNLIN